MTVRRRFRRLLRPVRNGFGVSLAYLALGSGLSGCVSLLPKGAPVQLYRFGQLASPAEVSPPSDPGVGVILTAVTLPRASVGDQILTVTGNQAAYVAGARWLTPASPMFKEGVERAFDVRARAVRLLHPGDVSAARALLRLDVASFEARYDAANAAPTVVISVRASLTRLDGAMLGSRTFTTLQPATGNRVGAIVAAFDASTSATLTEVVSWTDETVLTAR